MIYRFGVFDLDDEAGELRKGGRPVALQPKPLALLDLLVRERHRVVSTDEIFEALWPGTTVTQSSLTRAVSHARRAIDDTHRGATLRSFPRRGYRFCAEVSEIGHEAEDSSTLTAASAPPDAIGPSDFVGRQDATEALQRVWTDVSVGRGRCVVVSGPPGIGKTRLTEVFAKHLSAQGVSVVIGRARDGEGVPAFWIWAQILRQLLEEPDYRDHLAEIATSVELGSLVPANGEPGEPAEQAGSAMDPAAAKSSDMDLSPEQRRFLFFDAMSRGLSACSIRRPLVVILEDVQWASSSSLKLLEHLVLEMSDAPLLLVATARDEVRESGHRANRTLATIRREDRCEQIDLSGLSRGDVGFLLEQASGRHAPSDLISELFARTEGVPLFVREAIRVLADRGDLNHPERVRRRGVTLPEESIQLIRRSLDSLSPPVAELLEAAAVIGREFSLPFASTVGDMSRTDALDHLDLAIAAGVVDDAPSGPGNYRFTHALFQEAVYEGLSAGRAARLHQRAAERLEEQHRDHIDRVIAELAHHHHQSIVIGDPELAYSRAIQAAERAEKLYAYEQAAAHYHQAAVALDHCDGVQPDRRLSTLFALGDAYRLAGERGARREVFAEAMAAAKSLGWSSEFARAAIGFCDLSEWGPEDVVGLSSVQDALAMLDDEPTSQRAKLTSRLGYLKLADPDVADPDVREAVRLARQSGDPEAIQEALYILVYRLAGPDFIAERRDAIDELVVAARRCNRPDTSVIAALDIACDYLSLGDRNGAQQMREESGQLAGRTASPVMRWHLGVFDAGVALLEGRLADSEGLDREALDIGRRIEHPFARACFNAHEVLRARERGDFRKLAELYRPALTRTRGAMQWVRAMLGSAELVLGNEAAARQLFEEVAVEDFLPIPRNMRWTGSILEIARLCAELGDRERAVPLLALLKPVEHHHGVMPMPINYAGPTTHCIARLQEVLGESDEAAQLYEEALLAADAMAARPTVARIGLDYAPLLIRRGDAPRARELAADALRVAQELGLGGLEARARAALA